MNGTVTSEPLKIYMCDLTYDTIVLVSDAMPINIGFIASYTKKLYGNAVELSLFKYPGQVIDAIKAESPDVLALSNYSWNSNLSERVANFAKEINPAVITIQGGTNFPHQAELQLDFILGRPSTDIFIELEGEVSFSNLIGRILAARDGGPGVFEGPVDGCLFVEPSTRLSKVPELIKGDQPARLKSLDDIPSPYLNGLMDTFFDGRLTPFLETNRGCPFKCSFCHTGNDYFQKVNMFSVDRISEEIAYIAPRVAELGIVNLHIADTNFGMYPRDRVICEALRDVREKYGWPQQVMVPTGKNNKERVIEITGILGTLFRVNMSVQSMDPTVLANINRSNIKLDHYTAINDHLREQGRSGAGEVILGLPGETKESFIRGLEQLIESGVSQVTIYTLMLLHGTDFKNPAYRQMFGIKGKYRIVPLNFGEYEDMRVFDYEEVGIENNDMSFDDYLYLRGFSLMVETLLNSRPFEEFFRYGQAMGISRTDFLRLAYDSIDRAPDRVREIVDGFMFETQNELWDSEEALVEHYRQDENYERLKQGEVGGNLIYKYKSMSIAFAAQEWIEFLSMLLKEAAVEQSPNGAGAEFEEIDALVSYCSNKMAGLLDVDGDTSARRLDSSFDIVGWLRAEDGTRLADYACAEPITYTFEYTDEQLRIRADQFKRWGVDVNALSKIVTRVSNVESLVRKVRTPDSDTVIYADQDLDRMTRYALSN